MNRMSLIAGTVAAGLTLLVVGMGCHAVPDAGKTTFYPLPAHRPIDGWGYEVADPVRITSVPGWQDKPVPMEQVSLTLGGGVKDMEFVLIPAGEFLMGSPDQEKGRCSNEGPQHKVRISRPFYMGKFEVTQGQWMMLMDDNPSASLGPGSADLPVEKVSWDDCQLFCKKLNARLEAGCPIREVRLPTEAEWEYACRAGKRTRYSFGDRSSGLGSYAWYKDNSGGRAHRVGGKCPNAWGLYDMHGNVWEWCEDTYDGYPAPDQVHVDPRHHMPGAGHQVIRGGSFLSYAVNCRSARRSGATVDRSDKVGLRLVGVYGRPDGEPLAQAAK